MTRREEADSILIVDDAPKVCGLLARALSDLPYRILTADSVRSAKEILHQIERIRMLIVDFGLPDGNGFDIVEAVRKLEPHMPILLISGYDVGAVDVEFMLKPFDPEELLDKVELMAK